MRTRALVLIFALASTALFAEAAWARSYHVERMDAALDVGKDGRVAIEERITIRFSGSFNGIYRVIPYGIAEAWGLRDLIPLDIRAVEDDAGHALEHWTERESGKIKLKIRVPGASNASRTVVLRYVVQNVVRSHEGKDPDFGAYDELYWNVTGNAWDVPIASALARVRLPEGIAQEDIQANGYTGMYGGRSKDYERRFADDGRVLFETTDALSPGEGFTISVMFPPGHVKPPSAFQMALWRAKANWMLLLPLLGLLFWFMMWMRRGRDVLDRSIIPEFERPAELPAAEAGILIDDTLDPRDLSAAVTDLAVKGYVRVVGAEDEDDVVFQQVPDQDTDALTSWERHLLTSMFDDDEEVTVKALQKRLPARLGTTRERLLKSVVARGLYPQSPKETQGVWFGLTVLALILLVIVGVKADAPIAYWGLTLLGAIGMFILGRHMPRRTKKGLDLLARLRGLEDYMRTAEEQRMRAMPLEQLEGLIPFAVAFGVHERWADKLKDLFQFEPEWYERGGGPGWNRGMVMMDSGVRGSTKAPPRVQGSGSSPGGWNTGWGSGTWSGGSGWGGGGSVGGGFGGGGGGAW